MPSFLTPGSRSAADVPKLISHVRTLENRADNFARWAIHDRDEALWRLDKYTLEEIKTFRAESKQWPSFTSNDPRTYWNAVRRAVTSNAPRFRIKLPSLLTREDQAAFEEQLDEISLHEHFAYGVWHDIDEKRIRRESLPFQDQLAWQGGIRGGMCVRPWYDEDEGTFDCPIWDMKTMTWEKGEGGLDFVAHHYWAPYYDVADRYPDAAEELQVKKDPWGNTEVYDIWWVDRGDQVWNTVTAQNGIVLKKPAVMPKIDHIPVFVVRSFGPEMEPDFRRPNQPLITSYSWESIYTANADVYAWFNRIMTLEGLVLRNNAIGPWFAKDTGIPGNELQKAMTPFNVIVSNRQDAEIGPIQPAVMSPLVKDLRQDVQGMMQRGSVPYSIFGQIPFQLSGFAVNQLQGAVEIVVGQLTKQMEAVYRMATDEFIQQYRQKGKRKLTLHGLDTRGQQFITDIERARLAEKYYIEVDISAELPSDKLQEAQIAQTWSGMGIDPLTIIDEILKMPDPQSILRRKMAWMVIQQELQGEQQPQAAPGQPAPPGLPGGANTNGNVPGGPPPEVQPPEFTDVSQHQQPQATPSWIPRELQQIALQRQIASGYTGR